MGIDNRFFVRRIAVGDDSGDTIYEYELLEPGDAELLKGMMGIIFDYYVWGIKAAATLPHASDTIEVTTPGWAFLFDRDDKYNLHLWIVSHLDEKSNTWNEFALIPVEEYRELKEGGEITEYILRHKKP